jgi:hypothetical protein
MKQPVTAGLAAVVLLLPLGARTGAAQDPHTGTRTSVMPRLPGSAAAPSATGRVRELVCRGTRGIDMRVHQDPSPRSPALVAMVLHYGRAKAARSIGGDGTYSLDVGGNIQFTPGSCTWSTGTRDAPLEPGVVYVDLPRDAQAWLAAGSRDTSVSSAAGFADVTSLPRYLSDSSRYWVFYVDDVSNVSISSSAWPKGGVAQLPTPAPSPPPGGGVGGSLRDDAPGGASVGRALPSDPASRRSAMERTPIPGQSAEVLTSIPQVRPTRVYNVRTAAGPRGVRLTFDATGGGSDSHAVPMGILLPGDPTAGIRVQFSRVKPAWNERERLWSYPAGSGSPWFAAVNVAEGGRFEAEPREKLVSGERYHYLITVYSPKGSSRPAQRTGSFTADVRTPLNELFSK